MPLSQASACPYVSKAKSFYLLYRFGASDEYNVLKLKSPSRLARETFLISLGIARYQGSLADLNKYSVLFPDLDIISEVDEMSPIAEVDEKTPIIERISKRLFVAELDRGTPVNSKMMAIENELEQDMVMMRDKLEVKNKIVSDLREELIHLQDSFTVSKAQYNECNKNLRLSERRVE